MLSDAHNILGAKVIFKEAAVAAGGQHYRLAGNIGKLPLPDHHRAAHPVFFLHQLQHLTLGKDLHLPLRQLLPEDFPGAVKFDAVPVPVLVVEAGDEFLLGTVIRPAQLHAHPAHPVDGRMDAGNEGAYHFRIRHIAADTPDGFRQIGPVFLIGGADET